MDPAIADLLQEARELHRQGEFAQASTRYAQVLQAEPLNADALYYLAQASCQQGRLDEAVGVLRRALAADPRQARAHNLIGQALAGLGSHRDALSSFDAAIALAPELPGAYGNRADALAALGRHSEAIESYDRALGLAPQSPENWFNRGAALHDLKRYDEALASYDRALALNADVPELHVCRGNALVQLDRRAEAISAYDRVLESQPTHYEALRNRGAALLHLGRLDEALNCFQRASAVLPEDIDALYSVAYTLGALDRDEDALAAYDKVLAARPDHIDALMGRGAALQNLCRYEEAVVTYEKVLTIDPEHAGAHYSESMALLSFGDYRRGWPKYEWRRRLKEGGSSRPREYREPLWRGEDWVAGKTLLLHAEQGMGDVLQAMRYLPLVAQSGAIVVLQVHPPLKTLLSQVPGVAKIVGIGELPPRIDCHCPLMSLPLAFKTEPASIPRDVPYITAADERVAYWRSRLPESGHLRAGLVWSGNPNFKEDHKRSLRFEQIAPLVSNRGVTFIGLNPGISSDDAAALEAVPNAVHVAAGFSDFADTAAVIAQLDLVITSDTAVAHLAGAMGRPLWIMLAFSPDWRWAADRDRSTWYPTARLFRQTAPGDWAGVIERVRRALSALAANPTLNNGD